MRVGPDEDRNGLSASQPSRSPGFARPDSARADASQVDAVHAGFSHTRSSSDSLAHVSTIDPRLHAPHDMQDERSGSTHAPSTPSINVSPRFNDPSVTPSPNLPQQFYSPYTPSDRKLPSRDVSDETIDDAYAEFILYCNPFFPLNADTTELRKAFRAPPKSDGKSFNIYNLFELIRRFNNKDIKTWTQLALELGVEPPSAEKGQSTQKVQQYSVRLKRWMRAMHVDAFFEFLLNKLHPYWTQIPPADTPHPEGGRDGVPLEEDLAIRAIDSSFRPKRGRRKVDEQDDDNDKSLTPAVNRRSGDETAFSPHPFSAQPISAFPSSAYPVSGHPDNGDRYSLSTDQWPAATMTPTPVNQNPSNRLLTPHSAIASATPQHLRWRFHNQSANEGPQSAHPLSAQPLSAVTPITGVPPDSALDEPQSAVTPTAGEKPRKRRRHGPAVSSAWSSSTHTPNGKLRGRPPSNRSVRDGPFVTFPANPQRDEAPTIDIRTSTPIAEHSEQRAFSTLPPTSVETENELPSEQQRQASDQVTSAGGSGTPASAGPSGRAKLSLQVPRHTGGPVQQISGPQPPTLLVNGDPERFITGPGAQDERSNHDRQDGGAIQRQGERNAGVGDSISYTFGLPSAPNRTQVQPGMMLNTGPSDQPPPQRRPGAANPQESSDASRNPSHIPPIGSEELKRALAADLLRADITGRSRLKGTEAKSLAEALLIKLQPTTSVADDPDAATSTSAEDVHKLTAALWLGLSGPLGLDRRAAPLGGQKKIIVRRSRMGEDGYEVPLDDDDPSTVGVTEAFDISWSLLLGGLAAEFAVKGLTLVSDEGGGMGKGGGAGGLGGIYSSEAMNGPFGAAIGPGPTFTGVGATGGPGAPNMKDPMQNAIMWKRRFEELKRKVDKHDGEMEDFKERILGIVL
ncbi:MAG: hypothetical protein M1821_003286 [Bathelium mastoideum]|nr:MAG: hypothetical protein M1821_003286 [Bathelium mastoideum]KAI9689356.1 MAG: hypothetical protein M1822_010007 [Bathelium mastoideum]